MYKLQSDYAVPYLKQNQVILLMYYITCVHSSLKILFRFTSVGLCECRELKETRECSQVADVPLMRLHGFALLKCWRQSGWIFEAKIILEGKRSIFMKNYEDTQRGTRLRNSPATCFAWNGLDEWVLRRESTIVWAALFFLSFLSLWQYQFKNGGEHWSAKGKTCKECFEFNVSCHLLLFKGSCVVLPEGEMRTGRKGRQEEENMSAVKCVGRGIIIYY